MPHSILQQAIKRSSELMETNNSASSRISDQLYSILEAGEGSTEIGDLLDQVLHNYSSTAGVTNPNYDWNVLRKFISIKEKISYIAAGVYTHVNNTLTPNNFVNDDDLRKDLDQVIHFLEVKLISNRDFTESWMLRHAAFNRFSAGLTAKESASLNTVAIELKKLCETNGFENLAQSTHFTKESDAQKIMKLSQVTKEISAHGVKIPDTITSQFDPLDKKIEPLKKLDIKYKHLINMLNMIHSLPAGYPSMIDQDSQRKLHAVLEKLGKKDTDFLLKPRETTKCLEFGTLKQHYADLADLPDFKKVLEEFGVTENEFQKWFLVYFTYKNSEKAKGDLDDQKVITFGERAKDYEQDHQKRRGNLRNRIFEIGTRMNGATTSRAQRRIYGGERATFANNQDYELANSYFSKFQNLFYVNERDAYKGSRDHRNIGGNAVAIENHYLTMRNTIAAILRKRLPALGVGKHKRHGSFPRKIYKWFEWFLKGQEEKGFWKMVKRSWENADHAEILAMVIMMNNQAQQKMFHGPKNPFEHKDSMFGKMFQGLHLAERYRQNFGKKIAPAANKFLKIVELAGKTVIGKPLVAGAEKYNNALKNYKRYKTPFYTLLPVTWIVAKGKDAYHGTQKYLSELKGEQVTQISSALVDATDAITGMVGKTVSYAGGISYDKYKTNQQRGVLSTFFELACEDEKRRELVQSSELSEIFNFQNRETYLFDEDGRVDMIEKKPDEDGDVKAGKALSKKIQEQLEQLQKGIDDKEDLLSRKLENATTTADQNDLLDKKSNLESRKGDVLGIRVVLEQLIPLLKNPTTPANQNAIENIIGTVTQQQNQAPVYTGLKNILNSRLDIIKSRKTTMNSSIAIQGTPDNDRKPHLQDIISGAEQIIDQQNIIVANNQGNGNNGQNQNNRIAAQNEIRRQENRIKQAEARLKQLNQELIELNSWESRVKKVLTFITTLRDDQNVSHLNEDTLNSLINSLDLTLYKPISIQQQTSTNLTSTLAA